MTWPPPKGSGVTLSVAEKRQRDEYIGEFWEEARAAGWKAADAAVAHDREKWFYIFGRPTQIWDFETSDVDILALQGGRGSGR